MRIVMSQYGDGGKYAVETTSDGSKTVRDLVGNREVGARISAYIEAACDDNQEGLAHLL